MYLSVVNLHNYHLELLALDNYSACGTHRSTDITDNILVKLNRERFLCLEQLVDVLPARLFKMFNNHLEDQWWNRCSACKVQHFTIKVEHKHGVTF